MDLKERYSKVQFIINELDRLNEELETASADISAIDITKEAVQTSKQSDLSTKVLKINNLKENIKECNTKIEEYKQYARKEIAKLEGNKCSKDEFNVMYYKYVMLLESYEIAKKMHYTVRWINKLHGYALNKLRKCS